MPHSDLHKVKKSKNYMVLGIIVFICVLIWAMTLLKIDRANAGGIRSCGVASSADIPTVSSVGACDIYTRQLQYRTEAIKLRDQMQQRSISYAQPSAALRKQYKANLQALHDSVTEDNVRSFYVTQDDLQ